MICVAFSGLLLGACATKNREFQYSGVTKAPSYHSNHERVAERLKEVGYTPDEANIRVAEMSDNELDYFGQHPEAIKRSGIIILGGLVSSSVYSSKQNKRTKALEEEVNRQKSQQEGGLQGMEPGVDGAASQSGDLGVEPSPQR